KPVPFTLAEMNRFRDVLVASGYKEANIVYLNDKTDATQFRPTKANILKQFQLLTERLRFEDSLVVVLSGHGVQYKGDAAGYFCRAGGRTGLPHKGAVVRMEGSDGLVTLLDRSKAGKKLRVVNACRNDPLSQTFLAAEKIDLVDDYQEEAPKGTLAIFAC